MQTSSARKASRNSRMASKRPLKMAAVIVKLFFQNNCRNVTSIIVTTHSNSNCRYMCRDRTKINRSHTSYSRKYGMFCDVNTLPYVYGSVFLHNTLTSIIPHAAYPVMTIMATLT